MKYGKLIDGALTKAPNVIYSKDKVIYQPNQETYLENGYKPIIEVPYPEYNGTEEKFYTSQYTEEDSQIVQTWIEINPTPDNSSESGV